jgi:ATP-binding cassette subfamily C (CFTR/MRP) protein 1
LSIADQILVLGKDGIVTEAGSFTDLLGRGGYVSSISKTEKREVEDHPEEVVKEAAEPRLSPRLEKSTPTDKRRQAGDRTVYRYYFSSMGIGFTAILLFSQASSAFLQTFPSKNIYVCRWDIVC